MDNSHRDRECNLKNLRKDVGAFGLNVSKNDGKWVRYDEANVILSGALRELKSAKKAVTQLNDSGREMSKIAERAESELADMRVKKNWMIKNNIEAIREITSKLTDKDVTIHTLSKDNRAAKRRGFFLYALIVSLIMMLLVRV